MGKYFGTDGIRGVALETLNAELAFRLGQAIGQVMKPKEVVIGMDTRASSPMLGYSIANGLMALGIDVLFAGVVSTPMVAHYSKIKSIIGVMITASHNPYTDNGIKVFNHGYKTTEMTETDLETFIDFGTIIYQPFGKLIMTDDVHNEYLKIYDQLNLKPSNFKIGYDSANGANYQIAKEIFNRINPRAIQISNIPDGQNINRNCGSTHLEPIIQLIQDEKLDIAFSFDGDGDRIILLDDQARVYDGDLIIYIIGSYLKKRGLLNHNKVVLTKMSNPGILKAFEDQGISYVLTDVGDKYVFHELYTHGYTIGGESSGHVILTHLLHTGDGLLVAIYLIKILEEIGKSLKELIQEVNIYPLKLTNIKGIEKSILKKPSVIEKIESVRERLGKNALLLVRASGTENLIRVTISHENQALVDSLSLELSTYIKTEGEIQ
jgi:phosphoglucosamine mutase